MSRDNVLFALVGLLFGFISGYVIQDVMAARQPPRRIATSAVGSGAAVAAPANAVRQPNQEIVQLEQYVRENPNDADAVLRLANLNYDIRNWPRARDLYEQHLALRPESPDVITDLGVCYRELGDYLRAVELFGTARKVQTDHWQSRFNEVVVRAFDLDDYEAARKLLEELRALQPENSDVQRLAAEVERRADAA